jgi:predicted MFS family arabinose efflux permease
MSATTSAPPATRSWHLTGLSVVVLVGLVAAVAQSFGRFTLGVVLPAVRDDLGLSNTVAGSLATVNVGAYLVGTLAAGWATARFRLLSVMRVGVTLVAAGMLSAVLAGGTAALAGALFVMGFGGALTWIPAPVVAASALAPERRGVAVAMMASGMGLGVVFSGQLAGFARAAQGDEAWRTVYLVQGLMGAVVVVGAWLLLAQRQSQPARGSGPGGFAVLRRMTGWLPFTVAYTAFGFMYLLILAFLTTKLEDDNGWSSSRASLAFTLLGVAIIFGGPMFVALATRTGPRRALVVAFGGWIVATLVLLPGWTLPTLVVSATVGLLFAGIPTLITLYVVTDTSDEDYGPTFAAATFAFGVAQMISPQLGGSIADLAGSFTPVFLLSAGLAAIGLGAALRLPSTRLGPSESSTRG